MKHLLYATAICLILASCEKKASSPILPLPISSTAAFDSMNIATGTLYHLVLTRNNIPDSSICIKFNTNTNFTEYSTYTDTTGLHFLDSLTYAAGTTYSEYQEPDPANYTTTVGYVFTDYYPIGGGLAAIDTFNFHNNLTRDTFRLSIGVHTSYYLPTGTFKGPQPDSPKVTVTFRK